MNLMILISQLGCFVKATNVYLLKFPEDMNNSIMSRSDFPIMVEALNNILNLRRYRRKEIIGGCVEATSLKISTLKNEVSTESNIALHTALSICNFFNSLETFNISDKVSIKYSICILKAILDAKGINPLGLYNDAIARIAALKVSSDDLKDKYALDKNNNSSVNDSVINDNFKKLIDGINNLVNSLISEVNRERKDYSIKLLKNIIKSRVDILVKDNLKSELFTYFSSVRIILALSELEKAIHDYYNNESCSYSSHSENINYKINILIVEILLHFVQNDCAMIRNIKEFTITEYLYFFSEIDVPIHSELYSLLLNNKAGIYDIANRIISRNIEVLDTYELLGYESKIMKLNMLIDKIIEKKFNEANVQIWNDLSKIAKEKIYLISKALDNIFQNQGNSPQKKDILNDTTMDVDNINDSPNDVKDIPDIKLNDVKCSSNDVKENPNDINDTPNDVKDSPNIKLRNAKDSLNIKLSDVKANTNDIKDSPNIKLRDVKDNSNDIKDIPNIKLSDIKDNLNNTPNAVNENPINNQIGEVSKIPDSNRSSIIKYTINIVIILVILLFFH